MISDINSMFHGFIAASIPLIIFGAVFLAGYVARKILFKRLFFVIKIVVKLLFPTEKNI